LPDTEPKELGERRPDPTQGKRNDLHEVAVAIVKDKKRIREVANDFPCQFIKYHRGMKELRSLQIQPRNEAPEITVLWGKTGTGKSRKAREMLESPYIWCPSQKQWFDGYDGEDEAIFEEFRGQIPWDEFLNITDRYNCRVQVKGGFTEFRATKIVFTSPCPPEEWYGEKEGDSFDQLKRRITKIIELE